MNDRAIILSAAGSGSLTKDTCILVQQEFQNKFPEENIFVTLPLKMSSNHSGRADKNSLKEVFKAVKTRGYGKIVFQSLQVAAGPDFFRQEMEVQKSHFNASVGMPLLSSEIDCYRLLDALSDRIPDVDRCITVFVGEGSTNSTAGAMYMQFEGCVRERYKNNVYVSMIEGVPLWESAFQEIKKSSIKKIKFIPLMFEIGEYVKHNVQGRHKLAWSARLEDYTVDGIEQGLEFNEKILDIFFDHLEIAIAKLT